AVPGTVLLDFRDWVPFVHEERDIPVRYVATGLLHGQVDGRQARLRVREVRPDAPPLRPGRPEPPCVVPIERVPVRIETVFRTERQGRVSRAERLIGRERR